jgi:hypothetical protein
LWREVIQLFFTESPVHTNYKKNSGYRIFNIEEEQDTRSPEIRLWEAVIYRAVWDYITFWESGADSLEKLHLAKKSQIWIKYSEGFVWCCMECFPDYYEFVVRKLRQTVAKDLPPSNSLIPYHQLRKLRHTGSLM